MYIFFYNLSKKPFQINTDPHYLWRGGKYEEVLAMLEYGISSENGFLLLTGDVGTGKTTLINALLKDLQDDVLVANISNPNLELMDFFHLIAQSLGIQKQFQRKVDFLLYFESFLQQLSQEKKRVLLIIDEAQKLSPELLEEIRLLSNVERPEKNLISIFFVGQNEINHTLLSHECRALRQRITLNYNIKPLSESETREYIHHRLKVAGTEEKIFDLNAIHEIHRFSGGYPRRINILCDRALLIGYVRTLEKITSKVILECAHGLLLPDETKEDSYFNSLVPSIADNSSPAVKPLSAEEDIAFQATDSNDIPLMAPQALDDATPLNNERDDKKIREKALAQKKKGREYPAALFAFVKNAWTAGLKLNYPKMIYGAMASTLIFITAVIIFFSNNSSTESNLHSSVSQSLEPAETEKALSYSPSRTASEQAVVDLPIEADNANEVIAPQFPSKAEADISKPSDVSAYLPMEEKKSVPSPPVKAVEQEIPSSIEKTTNTPEDNESVTSRPFLLALAREAVSNKHFSNALELLEDKWRQEEELKQLYVLALLGQAENLLKEDTDQTEKLLAQAVKIDAQNARGYYDLGKLHTHTKDHSKAIDAYSMAVDLDPDSADTLFNLGFNYAALENYSQAEKMFLQAIELEPPYLDEAIFNLAMVQYKQGKRQQCIENLEKAIEVKPDNQRAQKYLKRFKGQ